jgi:hypothetical protein
MSSSTGIKRASSPAEEEEENRTLKVARVEGVTDENKDEKDAAGSEDIKRWHAIFQRGVPLSVEPRQPVVADASSLPVEPSQPVVADASSLVFNGIEPLKPRRDPFSSLAKNSSESRKYVIYLAFREEKDSLFSRGLAHCAETCSNGIHNLCFQRDGTRHVTMFEGKLTVQQASQLRFPKGDTFSLDFPIIDIELNGLTNWKAGVYLQLTRNTTTKLKNILSQLQGLAYDTRGKRSCDHISIYRKRDASNQAFSEFAKVRKAIRSHDWGSAEGVSIRIKEVGTDYDICRVLAGE